jgi:hypothetical protein
MAENQHNEDIPAGFEEARMLDVEELIREFTHIDESQEHREQGEGGAEAQCTE